MLYNKRLNNSVGATLCGRPKLNIAYKMKRAGIVRMSARFGREYILRRKNLQTFVVVELTYVLLFAYRHTFGAQLHTVHHIVFCDHCNRGFRRKLVEHHKEAVVASVVHTCYDTLDVVFLYKF